MVIHKCTICLKEFNKKSHYIQHIEKKKQCQPIEESKTENDSKIFQNIPENSKIFQNIPDYSEKPKNDENICKYCFKTFSTTFNLNKHIKNTCKVKQLENEKKQNILENLIVKEEKMDVIIKNFSELTETLKKQNEELKEKNEDLEKKINKILTKNTANIVNNTNNTQNITNNIIVPYTINPFGKESFKKINRKEFIKIVTDKDNNGSFCFSKLIDLIHFNNNIPENQNIYMNDYNRGLYMIHDGKEWNLRKDEEFIIFSVLEHVRDLFNVHNDEELEEKLESDPKFNKNFQATFKKYFNYVYDEVDDKELDEKELKTKNEFKRKMDLETKNKLYNKRHIPKANYDKLQNIINKVEYIEHK